MLCRNQRYGQGKYFQKCIEVVDSAHCQFVLDAFKNKVRNMQKFEAREQVDKLSLKPGLIFITYHLGVYVQKTKQD